MKSTFAIFNRNLSARRKKWLQPSEQLINIVQGKFGNDYFDDLSRANVAVNIHYSDKNLDDFETGIFEAMACGCLIISEKLYYKTIKDLYMSDAIIQVDSPSELKEKLELLNKNLEFANDYLEKSKSAIQKNTWHERANSFIDKFNEFI